jgi:hypothetical protein
VDDLRRARDVVDRFQSRDEPSFFRTRQVPWTGLHQDLVELDATLCAVFDQSRYDVLAPTHIDDALIQAEDVWDRSEQRSPILKPISEKLVLNHAHYSAA